MDLQTDATLQVDISDALSERDKVKFTVHTKVGLLVQEALCFCFVPWLAPRDMLPNIFFKHMQIIYFHIIMVGKWCCFSVSYV